MPHPTLDYGTDLPPRRLRLLRLAVDVRQGEAAALLLSAAYFFCIMAAYYPLRNVRDVIGSLGGAKGLSELFTATFVVMLVAVPVFSWLVSRFPRRTFLPLVYHFFALNLLIFYGLFHAVGAEGRAFRMTAASYFVWVSVFNLFVVSVFWGFMADLWRNEQGKRLFGFIGAGASAGAIGGASVAAFMAQHIGSYQLLLIAVVLLEAAVVCIWSLSRLADLSPHLGNDARGVRDDRADRGSWWEAFTAVARSPYLVGIASWVLFYTATNTLLYFIQADLVDKTFATRDARTAFFGRVDLAMNVTALLIQATVTGRVMSRLGVTPTLLILPATTLLGFAALWATHRYAAPGAVLWGAAPLLWVFVAVRVVRSGSHYALAKPAREVLFTVVSRAEKYKAKVFIDTAIYRGGDVAAAWVLEGARRIAGLMALTGLGIPLALGWAGLAVGLGIAQRRRADRQAAGPPPGGFEPTTLAEPVGARPGPSPAP